MKKWKRRLGYAGIGILLCLCIGLCSIAQSDAKTQQETTCSIDGNKLYAQSAVLMDGDSGRILFAKNGQEQRPMASTTKIMTLIVTLENANLEDLVTVSEYAASMPDVQLHMRKGESYQLKDLLYSLMLESHNDSAVAIAEYVGGEDDKESRDRSREESEKAVNAFCSMMNQKARDIGCYDTCFLTPNGLDATATVQESESGAKTNDGKQDVQMEHSTTAEDLARIMSYCVTKSSKKELFLEITQTPDYHFSNKTDVNEAGTGIVDGSRSFQCRNHNAFLQMMEGAISGKTGYTSKAGYCYIGCVREGDRTFVVSLLGCGWPNHKGYKWADMKYLIHYGMDEYIPFRLSEAELDPSIFTDIPVRNGKTEKIGEACYAKVDVESGEKPEDQSREIDKILLRKDEKVEVTYEKSQELQAPVTMDQIVGTVVYKVGEEVWKRDPILVKNTIEKIDYKWCAALIFRKYFL
ncbi:MAG: D-alanyl-D-alanine carboxypeptidase [Lachnospiraceae bacterium]|nr:D-alanyl-D-alanine carboxypeptidase [Lachnospiraceae bacterium]